MKNHHVIMGKLKEKWASSMAMLNCQTVIHTYWQHVGNPTNSKIGNRLGLCYFHVWWKWEIELQPKILIAWWNNCNKICFYTICIHTYHALHYITLHYITVQYSTVQYSTLQHITLHYIRTYVHTYIRTYVHRYIHT